MQRIARVIGLKPGMIDKYKRLSPAVWHEVAAQNSKSNIHNDKMFLREPKNLLSGNWEYEGKDSAPK